MVMVPAVHNHRGGGGSEVDTEQVDAVFAQILHHDLRCVVDRPSPSHAALTLRNEVSRSLAANPAVQGRGGGQQGGASAAEAARRGGDSRDDRTSSCRLLVQLEEVVNVAISNEARMQRDVHNDPATNSNSHSSSSSSSSGPRCLKLQLVDGYQHPLQPRHNPASNTHAPLSANSAIVAMVMSPIPNLTDQAMAGTKLLLTLGGEEELTTNGSSSWALRISHGVLLLTPQNCLVVGGHVPELAAEQARQRKALHDQSGASITDPTIRALVSHNYMTDGANAEDDDDDEGTFTVASAHICFLHALTGSANDHPSS
jgi:RecQ mediated genome instability protein